MQFLPKSKLLYKDSLIIFQGGQYVLYTGEAFRYDELYTIPLRGDIFDSAEILDILGPYYENELGVDNAVLTPVSIEYLFGELGYEFT